MTQGNNSAGIHTRQTSPNNGSSAGIVASTGSSSGGCLKAAFVGAAGIAALGAVWYLLGGEGEYMYSPNMGTQVHGKELAYVTNALGRMAIKKDGEDSNSRYALEIKYDQAGSYPLPTDAQIQTLLDKIPELNNSNQISQIYGHTPYLPGTKGLERFEMTRYFGADGYTFSQDQLYDTGYRPYRNEYNKARSDVNKFLPIAKAKGYQVLSCSYDGGYPATKDEERFKRTGTVVGKEAGSGKFAMHWYKTAQYPTKPVEVGSYKDNLETIGRKVDGRWQTTDQKHPFLFVNFSVNKCYNTYPHVQDPYSHYPKPR